MRKNNWPAKLALFVEEKRDQPFVWGQNDCHLFAADWVAICVGIDPAAPHRGKYRTARQAAARLRRVDVPALLVGHGWPEIAVTLASRGDLVATGTDTGLAFGVCIGGRSVFAGPNGLTFYNTTDCVRAWRIN